MNKVDSSGFFLMSNSYELQSDILLGIGLQQQKEL